MINAQGDAPPFFSVPIPIPTILSNAPHTSVAIETPISPDHTQTYVPVISDLTSTLSSIPTPNPTPIQPKPTSYPNPEPTPPPPTHFMITRSRTGSLIPKEFLDFQLYLTLTLEIELEIELVSYRKAAADPRWRHAMQQEYDALISNATLTLCPGPTHNNVIRNKWVFKIKKKVDGKKV